VSQEKANTHGRISDVRVVASRFDRHNEWMVFGNSADVKVCPWALNVGSVVYMRLQVKTHVPDP